LLITGGKPRAQSGEDAAVLARISDERGELPSDVVASLIREAAARVA
jgi:hypothetical protein